MADGSTADFNADTEVLSGDAQGRLKSFIERIERLDEDKAKRQEEEALVDLYLSAIGEI